ncbi:MAG: hypothetical protein JWQ30_46 [Sediminibacterium sp.]|nr:hypothetical protein [Sediminibacterium sp.]
MNTSKFLVSGIVGGIVSCLGGYLLYGMLLKDFFAAHATAQVMRPMDTFIWWSLIAGCIFSGLLYSYIFNKWANINSLSGGVGAGLVLGLLSAASMDLINYGTTNMMDMTGAIADIGVGAVLGALTGGAVGMMNGMGSKKAA